MSVTDSTELSVERLVEIIVERGQTSRSLTAIAGPPGSGKSTLADQIAAAIDRQEGESAAVLPMDGYHFDDQVLEPRGLLPRKGAPQTFDAAGFAVMLRRLKANAEEEIAVPVFDRSLEIARAGARMIAATTRHLIVEGNYLLLRDAPWSALNGLFDTTVFLLVPHEVLVARLEERWGHLDPELAAAKLYGNDLPNADLVNTDSIPAEFVVDFAV